MHFHYHPFVTIKDHKMTEASASAKKLQGKVAIVTGGAHGIGEATARLFADHGARAVVLFDIKDELGRQVAESIGLDRCSYVHCDVSDEVQVKSMVEWTVQRYGHLDIMFSNAGVVSGSDQKILDLDLSELDRILAINSRGMAACVKHAARAMVEGGVRGSIVCTASVVASRGAPRRTDYAISKHAVLGLVRCASLQLGVHGIRVNSVSPSAIATGLALSSRQEVVDMVYGPLTSLKGISLSVQHIADAVLFLASDDSAFVNGHDLVVDGGLTKIPGPNNET